ncbi:hypothetical protein MOX02_52400 [Methylobacterium oxalidis]|uniref:Uncharacterized protein n=1 Tax=Methylobacterium oxalidis TaxID=944322 RepID=A0A512JB64_9HYPH|nr:hypothetical protein MOX02_52400 [Methylobacterium oxalidis]GLS65786.1 hypothetical protein GCM10007888_41680 [Methylobacterium oxalidis]
MPIVEIGELCISEMIGERHQGWVAPFLLDEIKKVGASGMIVIPCYCHWHARLLKDRATRVRFEGTFRVLTRISAASDQDAGTMLPP